MGIARVFFGGGGEVFERFWYWAIGHSLRNLDDYMVRGEREHFLYAHPIG